MKKLMFVLLLVIPMTVFGQKSIDKIMEKAKVNNIEVMGHKFSVGDTLCFTSGSLPNGDFQCAFISSEAYMKAMMAPPHITAEYINHKFIISKIYTQVNGLNTETVLVFNLGKNIDVWVNPDIAITKKEIVIN